MFHVQRMVEDRLVRRLVRICKAEKLAENEHEKEIQLMDRKLKIAIRRS